MWYWSEEDIGVGAGVHIQVAGLDREVVRDIADGHPAVGVGQLIGSVGIVLPFADVKQRRDVLLRRAVAAPCDGYGGTAPAVSARPCFDGEVLYAPDVGEHDGELIELIVLEGVAFDVMVRINLVRFAFCPLEREVNAPVVTRQVLIQRTNLKMIGRQHQPVEIRRIHPGN